MRRRFALVALLSCTLLAALGTARARAETSDHWPPRSGPGTLFVHFGEEHVNDADGAKLLPKVVRESVRFEPAMVAMSGDKVNDGEPDQLAAWARVMRHYDRNGIPWFAAVGNHDRDAPPGVPGGTLPIQDFGPYRAFFADRPYPMGDAPGYPHPGLSPKHRPAGDPVGASTSYFVDHGATRWVFVDNSCFSILLCDLFQNPSAQNLGGTEPQFDFLRRVGQAASAAGKLVFVVMHMPTRDPGDQLYRDPTAIQHTMGKTVLGVADNTLFEQTARQAGVDGVFVAHIKGQFLYRGAGGIPYFIDGGAGGELYTTGPVGTDHGYWHGFRLVRVANGRLRTDVVPIFVDDGIRIEGPARLARGAARTFAAFGRQPVFNDPAKVPALELRDPAPTPRSGLGLPAWVGELAPWAGPPLAVLAAIALASLAARRRRFAVPALAALGALAFAGISAAQQSEPTSTPRDALPNPARIWTSTNPLVLAPVASPTDDGRRDPRTQTADGRFRAVCPGRARIKIASGFEVASRTVTVPSAPGPIVDRIKRARRTLRVDRRRAVARVELAQPAVVVGSVKRGKRTIAGLGRSCQPAGQTKLRWDGRRKNGRKAKPGAYKVKVRVLSDRQKAKRSYRINVR